MPFTERDVWDYTLGNGLPINPLYYRGFRSIDDKYETKPLAIGRLGSRILRLRRSVKVGLRIRRVLWSCLGVMVTCDHDEEAERSNTNH
ncbi:phosphoadenosine phosphosulfate reductase family protein [Vulcanisaeta distributa]|uniref:phosphoadenosine phosphosulfate reductase domain-containing protein n=1 Tax=Vulcanisaeta distributa TaxID=164451 RepID=UPI001FB3EB8B|nr:phosphoadenosine phosphosulfate reductase family protein [Vulcanisaeta distributa]